MEDGNISPLNLSDTMNDDLAFPACSFEVYMLSQQAEGAASSTTSTTPPPRTPPTPITPTMSSDIDDDDDLLQSTFLDADVTQKVERDRDRDAFTTPLPFVPSTPPAPSSKSYLAETPDTGDTRNIFPFMKLSGELRNRIYRYTLVEEHQVTIDATNWPNHQPGLLKVNKEIRAEALQIFYMENEIAAVVRDWNPVVKQRLGKLFAAHGMTPVHRQPGGRGSLTHAYSGQPNWENLLGWLKGVYEKKLHGISDATKKARDMERKTIGIMFMMARKARGGTMSWDDLKDLLEAQRGVLGMMDVRWLE